MCCKLNFKTIQDCVNNSLPCRIPGRRWCCHWSLPASISTLCVCVCNRNSYFRNSADELNLNGRDSEPFLHSVFRIYLEEHSRSFKCNFSFWNMWKASVGEWDLVTVIMCECCFQSCDLCGGLNMAAHAWSLSICLFSCFPDISAGMSSSLRCILFCSHLGQSPQLVKPFGLCFVQKIHWCLTCGENCHLEPGRRWTFFNDGFEKL